MLETVNFTTLRNHLADVLNEIYLKKHFILITKRNKTTGAIVNLDFFEDLLALGSKKYLKSIQQARKDYKNGKVFTHQEIFGKI